MMLDLHQGILEEFATAQGFCDLDARCFDLPRDAPPPPTYRRSEAELVLRRRAREALARWGVPCPGCGEPVYSTPGHKPRQYCSRRCNHRVWYERHPEAALEKTRRYRRRNRERVNAMAREQHGRRRAAKEEAAIARVCCEWLRALLPAILRGDDGELKRVA